MSGNECHGSLAAWTELVELAAMDSNWAVQGGG